MTARAVATYVPRVPARLLRLSGVKRGLALVYHGISERPEPAHDRVVPLIDAKLFEWQLRHLRRHYRVVPASELPAAARERARGEPFPVAVTFDDDLSSHAAIARPVLERVGVPATFFICAAWLGGRDHIWWETLEHAAHRGVSLSAIVSAEAPSPLHEAAARLQAMAADERDEAVALLEAQAGAPPGARMGERDVDSLAKAGFEIGFHTLRHPVLPQLEEPELAAAMTDGREQLEEMAGHPIRAIAYPHGQADGRVAAAARKRRLHYRLHDVQRAVHRRR
jgi:peptidoglycan/xylan/chitin deacetylase (PgdA/CDA1 family)